MASRDEKVISLKRAKEQAERRKYAALVLKTYDAFEHADRREFLDRKAAAENAYRQKL